MLPSVPTYAFSATDTFLTNGRKRSVGIELFGRSDHVKFMTFKEAMDKGVATLAPKMKNIILQTNTKVEGLEFNGKELTHEQQDKVINAAGRREAALAFHEKYVDPETGVKFADEQSIWFTSGIKNAKSLTAKLNERFENNLFPGKPYAAYIESNMIKEERKDIYDRLENGEIRAIVSADMLIEGFDLPKLTTCYMERLTQSPVVMEQAGGRVARAAEGKLAGFVVNITTSKEAIRQHDQVYFGECAGGFLVENAAYEEQNRRQREAFEARKGSREVQDLPEGITVYATPEEHMQFDNLLDEEEFGYKVPKGAIRGGSELYLHSLHNDFGFGSAKSNEMMRDIYNLAKNARAVGEEAIIYHGRELVLDKEVGLAGKNAWIHNISGQDLQGMYKNAFGDRTHWRDFPKGTTGLVSAVHEYLEGQGWKTERSRLGKTLAVLKRQVMDNIRALGREPTPEDHFTISIRGHDFVCYPRDPARSEVGITFVGGPAEHALWVRNDQRIARSLHSAIMGNVHMLGEEEIHGFVPITAQGIKNYLISNEPEDSRKAPYMGLGVSQMASALNAAAKKAFEANTPSFEYGGQLLRMDKDVVYTQVQSTLNKMSQFQLNIPPERLAAMYDKIFGVRLDLPENVVDGYRPFADSRQYRFDLKIATSLDDSVRDTLVKACEQNRPGFTVNGVTLTIGKDVGLYAGEQSLKECYKTRKQITDFFWIKPEKMIELYKSRVKYYIPMPPNAQYFFSHDIYGGVPKNFNSEHVRSNVDASYETVASICRMIMHAVDAGQEEVEIGEKTYRLGIDIGLATLKGTHHSPVVSSEAHKTLLEYAIEQTKILTKQKIGEHENQAQAARFVTALEIQTQLGMEKIAGKIGAMMLGLKKRLHDAEEPSVTLMGVTFTQGDILVTPENKVGMRGGKAEEFIEKLQGMKNAPTMVDGQSLDVVEVLGRLAELKI